MNNITPKTVPQFCLNVCLSMMVLFLFVFRSNAQQPDAGTTIIARDDLQADIRQCRKYYENNFANLYRNHSKAYVDSLFDALEAGVQPMSALSFFQYMSAVTQCIADGHVYMLPPADWRAQMDTAGLYLPLRVYYQNEAFYTEVDLRLNQAGINLVGQPITKINGVPSQTIYKNIMQILPVEQENTQYPEWIIERFFYEYYSYVYGNPDSFALTLANQPTEIMIPAATKDDMFDVRMQLYQAVPYYAARNKGISFEEFTNENTAILTIYTWDTENLKHIYQMRFKQEIDTYMHQLLADPPDTLIIDLRDNQGGSFKNGIHMMRWLMDTSFNYIDEIRRLRIIQIGANRTRPVWVGRYQHIQPYRQTYTGKVIILTNGGSFSNSGIFSSLMQHYGRAIVVGEETGGSAHYLSGYFGMKGEVTLKHSKLVLSAINHSIRILPDVPATGDGVIPDIRITDSWNAYSGDAVLRQLLQK